MIVCNLLISWSCTIYVAKFVCCLPANDPEKTTPVPWLVVLALLDFAVTGKFFSLRNYFGSVWIALWSPWIVFLVCMDWVMVCKNCVLEIVGPRPPLIQLSTDIRGSWIKGGLGSSSFAPILCFFVMAIYNAMILLVGYLGSLAIITLDPPFWSKIHECLLTIGLRGV